MDKKHVREIDEHLMRFIVGVIALALSPAVLFLSGKGLGLASISDSYWTDAHDIFVGALVAVGFFLSVYNRSNKDHIPKHKKLDYIITRIACFCILCVAFFPTSNMEDDRLPAFWIQAIADVLPLSISEIHYTTAVSFFVCLIIMIYLFSVKATKKGNDLRATFYKAIALLMPLGMGLIFAFVNESTRIFWVEVWGLVLFGAGWIIAGAYKKIEWLNK